MCKILKALKKIRRPLNRGRFQMAIFITSIFLQKTTFIISYHLSDFRVFQANPKKYLKKFFIQNIQ